jgi:hypothetical protein
MSYYRRLIEESEKKRILGMHNTYKTNPRTWVIREAYSGTAGEKFDSVEACKKQLPYNVATTLGINWNEAKKSWGSDGSQQQNLVLRNAMCDGWRIGDAKEGAAKPVIDQSKVQSGGDGTNTQVTNVDEFIKKESELLSNFGPERFETFKKLPNLTQGTIGQSSPSDYATFPSLQGKLPTNDFLFWQTNQLAAGQTMPTYYLENGLIIKLNDDKKDAQILGNWLQGTKPGTEDKKYSEEYITPTFG